MATEQREGESRRAGAPVERAGRACLTDPVAAEAGSRGGEVCVHEQGPLAGGMTHACSPLSTQEVSGVDGLSAHAAEWRRLVDGLPEPSLFNTWEWTSAKLESFWPAGPIAVLLVRQGGGLIGAAPLVLDGKNDVWCNGSLVVPEERVDFPHLGRPAEFLEAVLAHLLRTRRHFRLGLPRWPAASPLIQAVPEVARAQRLCSFVRPTEPSRLVLTRGGWDSYLASRSSHVKREWRRKRRLLEKRGTVEIQKVTTRAELDRALGAVLAIEEASWKQEAGLAISAQRRGRVFYSELARRCADRGWLRLHVLSVDGRPVAHFLGVEYQRRLYAVWTSYDQSYAQLSPGIAVVLEALQDAFVSGVTTVELLGAEMRWKREVANGLREHVHACVYSRGALGCHACSFARGRVRPALEARAPSVLRVAQDGLRRLREHRTH